ncbi:phosphatase 2C-like domain-containing protein, partial [Paraphysoderma sedebokerense]
MGQTLSEPVTEKHSAEGGNHRLIYGASSMQGWRISMEDAHTTELSLGGTGNAFFGVYDGHGGQSIARFSGAELHNRIARDSGFSEKNFKEAIRRGFLALDQELKANPEFENDPSGCTAVTAVITEDDHLLVGNAGDSRAVLSHNGTAEPMSHDHKPVNPEEASRIVAAGGFVEFGRVNGNLALSRAIGDFEFKQNKVLPAEEQIVTANPDILERKMEKVDEFLVLACDGIWDCMTNQDVVDFVRRGVAQGHKLSRICEDMMDHCLAPDSELGGIGCDNMTVIIVGFLFGKTEEEWFKYVKEK